MTRYDVMRQFTEGFAAAVRGDPREGANAHWLAGWDAGYPFRKEKSKCLDEYLIRTGREPQAVYKLTGET